MCQARAGGDPDPHPGRNLGACAAQHERTGGPRLVVQTGAPMLVGADMLPDASPIGMLRHTSKPAPVAGLVPPGPVAFDAIVKAEQTRLQAHRLPGAAEVRGCVTVCGREMMRGQIRRIVDFFNLEPVGPAGQ